MEGMLFYAVIGVLLLLALKLLALKLNGAQISVGSELGYRQKKTLFTPAERSFLGVLDQVIDKQQHRVFGKIRVADLIEPNPSRNRSQWQKSFNAISAKHFDFVICTADTQSPLCVIELDDKSHNQKHRQQRDQLLESVCQQADLHLIRVPARRAYKPEEVKRLLVELTDVTRMNCLGDTRKSGRCTGYQSKENLESAKAGEVNESMGEAIR